jgi:phospholipid/cholesterol/gamma-HCH transport system substrate-binding protein
MSKRSIEVMVGLFVLLGLAGLLFLALQAANLASFGNRDTYTVSARFDNIGGLKSRAAVRSAGVTVGRVTSITLDTETYKGVVTMEIQTEAHFPTDSSAKILTSGLLGDQYIGIEPGGDIDNLVAGAVIKETQSAVVLEDLISQVLFSRAADAGTAGPPSVAAPPSLEPPGGTLK